MSASIADKTDLRKISNVAEQAAIRWNLNSPIKFIRQSENFVYEIDGHILRITENSHRTAMQLNAELDFIATLFDKGVSVATPHLSSNGLHIETIEGLHISVFKKASGVVKSVDKAFSSLEVVRNLGRELGKIHTVSADYIPREYKRHHSTDINYHKEGLKFISADDPVAVEEFQKAMRWVESLPKHSDRYGLLHMDAHPGNFAIDDNNHITLFDFDDCAYNFYAYDLATPLSRLNFSNFSKTEKQDVCGALLEGYVEEHALPNEWLTLLDGFIRFRFIELFAWRCMMFGVPHNDAGHEIGFSSFYKLNEDFSKPYPSLSV